MKRLEALLIAALVVFAGSARGQAGPGPEALTVLPATEAPKIPDSFKLNMMIRSTVIAVNQANKTGNYTVLRDLGSPRFKEANSADRLAKIFESLRKANFDLAPVLFFTPKLLRAPALEDRMLRLTGYFDTVPQRVSFDFLFEDIKGEWMIYGINIATEPSPAIRPPLSAGESRAPAQANK